MENLERIEAHRDDVQIFSNRIGLCRSRAHWCHEKANNVFLNRSDTNRAVEAQKMASIEADNFRFSRKVEELYYPCSANNGAAQLCSDVAQMGLVSSSNKVIVITFIILTKSENRKACHHQEVKMGSHIRVIDIITLTVHT